MPFSGGGRRPKHGFAKRLRQARMKNPEHERKVLEILDQAWDLGPAELQILLDQTCGQDAALRQAVLADLEAGKENSNYMEAITLPLESAFLEIERGGRPARPALEPGQRFDRYEIV